MTVIRTSKYREEHIIGFLRQAEVGLPITANYDGANKHRTVIKADVHIGSNCVPVAPITVGAGGTVGGGYALGKSTKSGGLHVARAKQISLPNWKRLVTVKK